MAQATFLEPQGGAQHRSPAWGDKKPPDTGKNPAAPAATWFIRGPCVPGNQQHPAQPDLRVSRLGDGGLGGRGPGHSVKGGPKLWKDGASPQGLVAWS